MFPISVNRLIGLEGVARLGLDAVDHRAEAIGTLRREARAQIAAD
jgi:hypothetical protein